jgi:hypothetical protein
MTSIRAAVVGAVGCIVLAGGVPAAAQGRTGTPEELYQQALTRERAAGDIQGAIQLYREVAASTDRVFAARALLRLGQAYEKLGASESQAAYERIVREFADQSEPVSVARTRLAALRTGRPPAQSAVAPALSMILAELPALRPRDAAQFDFSPSGDEVVFRRSMADSDPLAGSALEIAASGGAIVRTLLPADRQMGRANPRWSPDGRYIAYLQRSFVGADTSFVGLMVVPSGGGTPRVVSTDVGMARPAQGGLLWTPDSRGIAVWFGTQLTTFDLDGRTVGSVPLRLRHQGQVTSYSPDGRWLAYHVMNEGSEQHDEVDVWIVSAQGANPFRSRRRLAMMAGRCGPPMDNRSFSCRTAVEAATSGKSMSIPGAGRHVANRCSSHRTRTRRSCILASSTAVSASRLLSCGRWAPSTWRQHRRRRTPVR